MLGSGTDLARSDRVRAATAPATPLSWTRTAVAADDVGTRVWDVPGYGARDGILAIQTRLPTDPPAFPPRTFHRMSVPWSTFWEMLAALTLTRRWLECTHYPLRAGHLTGGLLRPSQGALPTAPALAERELGLRAAR